MRIPALLFVAAFTVGCGATPTPPDPCRQGRCGQSPVAPQGEAVDGEARERGLEEASQMQAWRCREVPREGAGQPSLQCRVRLGPLRFAVVEGPQGTTVSALNASAQPLEAPLRTPIEGHRTFEGQR